MAITQKPLHRNRYDAGSFRYGRSWYDCWIWCPTKSGYKCTQTIDQVKELPEVLECYRVTESACFIAKVAVSSISHLEALMDRIVPYGTLTTSVVLSAPVEGRVIDLRKMAL